MAKPTTVPTWDNAGIDPGPSKQADGWAAGERPPADTFNWLFHWLGLWADYLDAGALDGNFSVSGTLAVTGATTATGLVTANNGVTLAANKDVTVSGTGDYKHGDKVLTLAPIGNVTGTVAWDFTNSWLGAGAAGTCVVPVPVKVGDRLKTITGRIYGNGVTAITVRLVVVNGSASPVTNGGGVAAQVPGAAWTTSNTTDGSLNHTVAAGESVFAIVDFTGTGRCQALNITYDRP